MPNDYLKSIDSRLQRIEDKLEVRIVAAEHRIDKLESIEDQRKGGLKMLLGAITFLGTFAGAAGSYLHDLVSKA